MEKELSACPSFLKLLMDDDYKNEIRIPNAFVKDFKNKLSKKCVLKSITMKKSWSVRIRHKDNNFFICKRAWPKFVMDYKLKYGDYLVFYLVKKATFKVTPYGADCSRKLEVSKDEESDSSSSSDEEFNKEDGDGDDDSEDDDHIPSKGQSAKNANYRKTRVHSGRCDNETQKSKHDKRNSGVGGKEEKEMGLGREETVCAKDGHFETNLKNPYFVKKLKKSHKSHMSIPYKFAKQTKLDNKETLFLHGEDDRQWPVKIRTTSHEVFVGKGWFEFWKGYQIKVGDTCKFTLLRSLGNVFSVEIMRT